MIRDNFEQIKAYIQNTCPPSENNFYFCQIMQRKKDFNETDCPFTGNNRVLKSYFITRMEWFDLKRDEIVRFCNNNNARAMINLNPKSMKTLCLSMLKELAQLTYDSNYGACLNVRESEAGKIGCAVKDAKSWIVDIDDCSDINSVYIKEVIETIKSVEPYVGEDKVREIIPTMSGFHIISKPFNLLSFREKFQNIDIHKNNPTLLYANVL